VKVLMDAVGLPPYGGVRTAVINHLQALAQHSGTNEFVVLTSRDEPEWLPLGNVRQLILPSGGRFVRRLRLHAALPELIRRHRPDIVHFMRNLGAKVRGPKTVLHLHDLTRLRYPNMFSTLDVWYWKLVQSRILKRMDRIICVSNSTRKDLRCWLDYPDQRIRTVYEFAGEEYAPDDQVTSQKVSRSYGISDPFLLYVGGLAAHKNVRTLVEAFLESKRTGALPHQLVIVGGEYHTHTDHSLRAYARRLLGEAVVFTGALPNCDLKALYCTAELFVFPSLYEGFGLAPLEAMACGLPVVAARSGALPEVLGDAAVWVENALDPHELSTTINRVLGASTLRTSLRERSLIQAARFSPQATASQILAVYEELSATVV
jgi:glycosyltransferase involved in cell wall biosynthesis